jgi:hypothetical protein
MVSVSKGCLLWTLVCGLCCADVARAQSDPARIELGVQVASARSGEFEASDTGFGGRVSWRPHPFFGLEAEVNVFPRDFPSGQPFSRGRLEGLFGATAGATLNRIRPFARVRPGLVTVQQAPEPFACILIYPPPLPCTLAAGRTLLALDVGGGLDIITTPRTFVRVDLGDRLLKYPGPAFDADRSIRERLFFVHEFRVATGAGVRF